jgi:hypothetical protein
MTGTLHDVCCARLPADAIAALAGLRCVPGVTAIRDGDSLWLRWEPGREEILRQVLPLANAELYVQRDGQWFLLGRRLPAVGPPPDRPGQPLDGLVVPAPIRTEESVRGRRTVPAQLHLVRDGRPRPTTGMACSLAVLNRWAEMATTGRITSLRGARAGGRVLVLAEKLPVLPAATRLWGQRILVPLGLRLEPALPESAVVEALALNGGDLAVFHPEGVDVISAEALQPLTRAAIRQAHAGGAR